MAKSTRDDTAALRQALLGLRKLKARVAELEGRSHEPIAVIGIGCRFPGGVRDPEGYWRLLRSGEDAVGRVPSSRWDASAYMGSAGEPGRIVTDQGGFLDDVYRFDADRFGISHREARAM